MKIPWFSPEIDEHFSYFQVDARASEPLIHPHLALPALAGAGLTSAAPWQLGPQAAGPADDAAVHRDLLALEIDATIANSTSSAT